MPTPDETLDGLVNDLGIINVPALVEYLIAAHPNTDPYKLAAKVISLIEGSPYTMGFEVIHRSQ